MTADRSERLPKGDPTADRVQEETKLRRAHSALTRAFAALYNLRPLDAGASQASIFAYGEALGAVSRARALIARDIADGGMEVG